MRNKVLPSMLFGAAVAMGATTVFGLTPGTVASRGDATDGESDAARSRPLEPDTVAVVDPLAPPVATAPVTSAIPSPRAGDAPTSARREEDAAARTTAPSRAVPSPRTPGRAATPSRRPAASPARGPLDPVLDGAARTVDETGRAVTDTGRAVVGTGREVVDGTASTLHSTVDDVTGAGGRLLGGGG